MKIVKTNGLLCHYDGKNNPQPCYVELDCDDEVLRASYNADLENGVPMAVWDSRALRWTIPLMQDETADALLVEIAPHCETILAGYESQWNGNNYVGDYTDAADAAQEVIENICEAREEDGGDIEAWDAGDWYSSALTTDQVCSELGITSTTTDGELETIAQDIEDNETSSPSGNTLVLTGIEKFVEELRQDCIEHAVEEIEEAS